MSYMYVWFQQVTIAYYQTANENVIDLTDLLGKECWTEELEILGVICCLGYIVMAFNISWHERTITAECWIVLGLGQLLEIFQRHNISSVTILISIQSKQIHISYKYLCLFHVCTIVVFFCVNCSNWCLNTKTLLSTS